MIYNACAPPQSQPKPFRNVFNHHKHFNKKKLQNAPRGQSHILPIRDPFLIAHCSPKSHCENRRQHVTFAITVCVVKKISFYYFFYFIII